MVLDRVAFGRLLDGAGLAWEAKSAVSDQVIASLKNAIARRATIRDPRSRARAWTNPERAALDHTAKVDAFLGKLLGFLGGSGGFRIKVGMLRGWQYGSDVLTIRPCDAGNPALMAVLKSLDVILLVRNHETRRN